MPYYLVTYDIVNENARDLETHLEGQEEMGLACKPLDNLWIVKSNESLDNLCTKYKLRLHEDDRLFISTLPKNKKTFNIHAEAITCVKRWSRQYFQSKSSKMKIPRIRRLFGII